MAGVRQVLTIPAPRPGVYRDRHLAAGVAVVAEDFWAARQAREALKITWTPGPGAQDSSVDLERRALAALARAGEAVREDGHFDDVRRTAARSWA